MLHLSRFGKFLLVCGAYAGTSAFLWAAPPQKPAHSKTASDLVNPAASSNVSVIVQYIAGPSSAELAQLSALGGSTPVLLKSINAVQVALPAAAISTLSQDPNVSYITPDRALASHGATAPSSAQLTSIATSGEYTAEPINAPVVWSQGYIGTGIGVAVIDSGITLHKDLSTAAGVKPQPGASGRIVYSACFVTNCNNDTTDEYGHGTHVAGLVGGNGTTSTGKGFFRTFKGIAPNVNLINLKVLDANGQGTDTAVIQAIEAAISLKSTYNIRVINLSLGRPVFESYQLDPLCQAVEQAWKAGIVVVAAAGNNGRDLALSPEGYGTIEAPGNDPYVLTVGAVRTVGTAAIADDAMASYSSKGPSYIDHLVKPDLVAPGNLVISLNAPANELQQKNPTFFTQNNFYQNITGPAAIQSSPNYMPLSGTSMASGVASGAVALLINANSSLTPDQVKALLMADANKSVLPATSTVTDSISGVTYTAHNDVFTVGAGYLDINAAVKDALLKPVPAGSAMSPLGVYDPNSGNVGLVTDSTALWGATALWVRLTSMAAAPLSVAARLSGERTPFPAVRRSGERPTRAAPLTLTLPPPSGERPLCGEPMIRRPLPLSGVRPLSGVQARRRPPRRSGVLLPSTAPRPCGVPPTPPPPLPSGARLPSAAPPLSGEPPPLPPSN